MAEKIGFPIALGVLTAVVVNATTLLTFDMGLHVLLSSFLGGLMAGVFFREPIRGGGKMGATIAAANLLLLRPLIMTVLNFMGLFTMPEEPPMDIGIPLLIVLFIIGFAMELGAGFGGGVLGSYLTRLISPISKPPEALGVCPNCGAKIPPEAVYCPYCGARVREQSIS